MLCPLSVSLWQSLKLIRECDDCRYGCTGPVFIRKVISTGLYESERVEFYPPTFSLYLLLPSSSATPVSVPTELPFPVTLHSNEPLQTLRSHAANAFNLDSSRPFRLWRLPELDNNVINTSAISGLAYRGVDNLIEDGAELIEINNITPNSTLNESLLDAPQTRIGVEQQTEDSKWLVDTTALAATTGAPKVIVPNELVARKKLFAGGYFAKESAPAKSQASTQASTSKGSIFSALGALTRAKSTTRTGGGQRGLTGLANLGK